MTKVEIEVSEQTCDRIYMKFFLEIDVIVLKTLSEI